MGTYASYRGQHDGRKYPSSVETYNRNFPAEVILDLSSLDRIWRLFADDLRELYTWSAI
jgi:hypothetical protein